MRDRSPVIICTLLIAIGWILVLLNAGRDGSALPTPQELFRPAPTPMTLAFLGAYFLSVQVGLRGDVRGDLKPKTYNVIAVRIIMAVVLAWSTRPYSINTCPGGSMLSVGWVCEMPPTSFEAVRMTTPWRG